MLGRLPQQLVFSHVSSDFTFINILITFLFVGPQLVIPVILGHVFASITGRGLCLPHAL